MVEPFLRWAGGKRWLAATLTSLLKERTTGTYYETFIGGGAMFFGVSPARAVLSDLNADLLNAYRMVMAQPEEILKALKKAPVDADNYYAIRASRPEDELERAIRFIYLNRTCYGGIYRTNRKGEFNVPFGGGSRTPEPLWKDGVLSKAAVLLNACKPQFIVSDFEERVDCAGEGDLVYCDPTYATTARDQFDRYTQTIFSWKDQVRLAKAARKAFDRGALVVVSNCYSRPIQRLYPAAYRVCLTRRKAIGKAPGPEKKGLEYLMVLDPLQDREYWKPLGRIEARRSKSQIHTAGIPARVAA